MTVLVPMSPGEYEQFIAESVPAYAADKVDSGQWSPAESLALARKDFEELLPEGLATPGNHLFSIRPGPESSPVGWLWYAERERGGLRIAYVYDVSIRPEYQRQGHAARAFRALEEMAARQGLSGIALHVFGHNLAARALYAKLGFEPTNLTLYKPVGTP